MPESQQKASWHISHPTGISFGGQVCVGKVVGPGTVVPPGGAVGGTPVNSQVSIKSIVGSHPRKYILKNFITDFYIPETEHSWTAVWRATESVAAWIILIQVW